MTIEKLATIYKRREDGGVQIWYGELDRENGQYRTTSGLQTGVHTTSEWTTCEPKNVGRANATTAAEQAEFELNAMYEKRLTREYHRKIEDIDTQRFIEPMTCAKWKDRKKYVSEGTLIFLQPKLDGYRAIAQFSAISKHGVVFTSRQGKIFHGAEPLCKHLGSLFGKDPDLIFDGELYNHDFKKEFEELGSIIKKELTTPELYARADSYLQYHVYDLPSEAHLNYAVRYAQLSEMFTNEPELQGEKVQLVRTESIIWNDEGREQFDEYLSEFIELGYEGGIARFNVPYEFKRSHGILKIKEFMDEEFEIVGIEEGNGNWTGCAKRVFIAVPSAPVEHGDRIINRDTGAIEKYDGTQTNYHRCSKATPKGSQDRMREVYQNRHEYIGGWGTLQFFRYTASGVPYLPNIKTFNRIDDPRNN